MKRIALLLLFSCSLIALDKPNIIIILTDDLGWGDVSYHGGPIPTPNIDKLAKKGMEMNRFYSAPTCSPTRASMLTGINSLANGVIRPYANPRTESYGMPLYHKIMPEFLLEAGYQTALSGKWHLGMSSDEYLPSSRGFQQTYGHMNGGIDYYDHSFSGRLDWHRDNIPLVEEGYATNLIADEAIRIIKNKDKNKPLFLYVAFNAPHTPIQAEKDVMDEMMFIENIDDRKYAANIYSLDREIGKIINVIEKENLLENTIILFFSDNGPVFDVDPIAATIAPGLLDAKGNTMGLKGSKGSAYEGGIRVPAIFYWKGVMENLKSDQFFFSDDILPTLLSAANISYDPSKFTGVDRWDDLISNQVKLPVNAMTGNIIISDDRALFNDRWKLYYTQNVYTNSEKRFELYDIISDPFEKNDVSKEFPEIFKSMKKTLNEAPFVLQPPYINPTQMYLYGDQFPDKPEIVGSPWLDREYEVAKIHSTFVQTIVFTWVLFLAFKQFTLPLLLILVFFILYFVRKKIINS